MRFECPYCDDAFADEALLHLHKGEKHSESLDETEREDYAEAYERESRELRRFRLKAVGVLVVIYFGLLFAYSVFA